MKNKLLGLLADSQPAQGLLRSSPPVNALAGALGAGLAPFGFRHEESVFAPVTVKGRGFFGALPHSDGGVATEISAHDDAGGFPLLAPTLTQQELDLLLGGGQPTEDIYRKAAAFAAARRAAGLSPFSQPNELRMPAGLLGRD